MNHRPISVSATMIFILLNALIWLAFGAIVAVGAHPALPVSPLINGIMASLAFITAGILLALLAFLGKRNRVAYYLTLCLLVVISILTIFDDFGLADFVVLIINIAPFILLIKDRAWYLQERSNTIVEYQ
jgi:lysylphosphatidylglycerol synthetase-like protein (DUF2156 family)